MRPGHAVDLPDFVWPTSKMWPMNPGGNRGRPPLPDDVRRTTVFKVRVKPRAGELFQQVAEAKGLTVSDALREAMAEWVSRNRSGVPW